MSEFSAIEKKGKEKLIEQAVNSIRSLMKAGRFEIDRKYLPEIVSIDLLSIRNDGLPTLRLFVEREFNKRSIVVNKFKNSLIFSKGPGLAFKHLDSLEVFVKDYGVIICDSTGLLIDSDMDINKSKEVVAYVTSLIGKGKQVVDTLNEGTLKLIKLEASKGEITIPLGYNILIIIR